MSKTPTAIERRLRTIREKIKRLEEEAAALERERALNDPLTAHDYSYLYSVCEYPQSDGWHRSYKSKTMSRLVLRGLLEHKLVGGSNYYKPTPEGQRAHEAREAKRLGK